MPQHTTLPADHRREQFFDALKNNLGLLFGIVLIFWGVEIVDTVLRGALDQFGVQPRRLSKLSGILTSPFLHGDFGHLISNTIPFLILGGIVLIGGRKIFIIASILIIVLGGSALWLLGPPNTNHIGASSLIFGYLGFLLARGIVERSGFWIVISLIVLGVYGSMIFGVLPGQPGISWQGHLFGFLSGIAVAWMLFAKDKIDDRRSIT
ncbi:MAG: rhomboid family intramembrane serine protease [Verrucomicrobiales bacterium]|nr:rhomboid family intramembrane serine protease [Verrucomicrobiales bacterium]